MKKLLFPAAFAIFSITIPAQTPLLQAIKDPSAVRTLSMGRGSNNAAELMKYRNSFRALNSVIIEGVNDSIELEQDILSIAAIPCVRKVGLKNCGVNYLSKAMQSLTNVTSVEVMNCDKLDRTQLFSTIGEMRSIRTFTLVTARLESIPKSFRSLSGLHEVIVTNNDRSLADAYDLNNGVAEDLVVIDSLSLGFGADILHLVYSSYDEQFTKQHLDIMRNILQGEVFTGEAYTLPHRPAIFSKQHPLVKPPVPGMDVATSVYTVKASSGGMIQYPSGTRISVPANAFVDANGNAVSGDVQIGYREFRDQVDIMLSGIPMDYDSAGSTGHFVSAGMFDINASVDGKEVFLADGKDVKMDFAVVDTASNFNFYRLDESKGWVYQNSPGKSENVSGNQAVTPVLPSAAVQFFYDNIRKINYKRPGYFDPNGFESRYADLNYIYDQRKSEAYIKANKRTDAINKFRLQKVYRHRDTTCFRIERLGNFNYTVPEIRAFSGYTWMTTDNVRTRELKDLFRKKSQVHDLRVYEDGGGYVLEFKTPQGFRRIHAELVRMTKGKPRLVNEKYARRMFRQYSRILANRKGYLDRSIARKERRSDHWQEWAKQDSLKIWNRTKPKMSATEAPLDFDSWLTYYKKEFPKIISNSMGNFTYSVIRGGAGEAGANQAAMLYQALTIASFGIYNCDHVASIPEPIATNTRFDINNGDNVQAVSVYVIDRDVNSSTTFSSFNGKEVNITYNKPSRNVLVIIDKEGRMYTVNENNFQKGNRVAGSTRYHTDLVSDKTATPEQMRDILFGE